MNMTQRFFSRVSALAAFALALTAFGPQAQALKTRIDTPIGEISFAFDTVASVGISLRTKSRDYDWVAAQSGGSNADRASVAAAIAQFNANGRVDVDDDNFVTTPTVRNTNIGFSAIATGGMNLTGNGTVAFKGSEQKNFAGGANVDDGRLNFDKGDITALTLKVLSDIQADLSTKYGEFTAFMRVVAYADPVLRDGSFYERIGPDDAAKRELGRDLKILDGYLSWDWDIPTGVSEIGDLPFNLRVGKLTTNNWGEATFSLSGISAGIVIDVPSARRAGAEIKEIIQPEFMVYGSIGLPFDVSLDAYYQFHHTIWNLDVGGSPTATSDLGNPGNEIGSYLWLSSTSTSGTFRDNCSTAGSHFRQAARALNVVDGVPVDPLPNRPNCFSHTIGLDREARRLGIAAEQLRLDQGDLNRGTRVRFIEADDQGQWGVRLSYYIDTFYLIPPMSMMGMGDVMGGMMEDGFALPGIEFNFSFQNVHSRVPYVRYGHGGRPIVTKAIVGTTGTNTSIPLQASGCIGGAAPGTLTALVGALNTASAVGGLPGLNRGFLLDGQFRDSTIPGTQDTRTRTDVTDSDIIRLALDGRHFEGSGRLNDGQEIQGLAGFLPYARAADAILDEYFTAGALGTALAATAFGEVATDLSTPTNTVTVAQVGGAAAFAAAAQRVGAGTPQPGDTVLAGLFNPAVHGPIATAVGAEIASLTAAAIVGHSATRAAHGTIEEGIRINGPNRYDVARIVCAQALVQTGVANLAVNGANGVNPVVGSEFLTVQYVPSVELYYPEDIQVIGGSFNTTIPWMEWGIQGEISYRPNMPLQVDVTEQIISVIVSQGTGIANLGDAARFSLAPAVTTGADQNTSLTQAEADRVYDEFLPQLAVAVGSGNPALIGGVGGAVAIFSRPFIPEFYEGFANGTRRGIVSEFEADMLNYTIGTTALYNNSNPVVNFLGADQAVFLMEFNAIQFLDELPPGWFPGRQPTTRADKGITLHCIARSGTELPLGGIVGLDLVRDSRCTPDELSMGYTVFGFLDYNNVFGTAWRLRPSMAVRHGVSGNTPSPIPGWREDTLSVTWGLEANFQNSWRASMSYVAFFDVGSNDYNSNSGFDTWSFNISYAF